MYQRSYPSADELPPNYRGNAFGTEIEVKTEEKCCSECRESRCREEISPREPESDKEGLGSFLSRRDGSRWALDDLIIGGLIILLLNSHADDELLFILLLLFVCGI